MKSLKENWIISIKQLKCSIYYCNLRKKFNAKKVNFPHLVERVSLIIIIAFGEAIVNLANYFNNKTPIIYAILLFASFCRCLQVM